MYLGTATKSSGHSMHRSRGHVQNTFHDSQIGEKKKYIGVVGKIKIQANLKFAQTISQI